MEQPKEKEDPCITTRNQLIFTEVMVLLELKFPLEPVWPLPWNTEISKTWQASSLEMVLPIRVSSTKQQIWQNYGVYQLSTFVRTINMVWEHQYLDHQWTLNSTKEVMSSPASDSRETTYSKSEKLSSGQKIGPLITDLSLLKFCATGITVTLCLTLEFLTEREKRFRITEKAKIPF